jgi:hypothetical protein
MTAHEGATDVRQGPDLRLVIARLEAGLVDDGDPAKVRLFLSREQLWQGAAPEDGLRLARLAQMAGELETAVRILERLTQRAPERAEAWNELLDLLGLLDDRRRFAQALAGAREAIGESEHRRRLDAFGGKDAQSGDTTVTASPFENLQARRQSMEHYLRLFSGREDCFARQWANRAEGKSGYVPERRPFGQAELEEHLAGRKTYGIYLLRSDARVRTAVIDMDLSPRFRSGKLSADDKRLVLRERRYLFARVREFSAQADTKPLVEFSGGKGFHFWYFFEPAVEAAAARGFLEALRQSLAGDVTAFGLEVFPKQDGLSGKGLGNLVKLPLGIHRLTGKRSYFIECADRSNEAQLAFLAGVSLTGPGQMASVSASGRRAEVVVHPRLAQWAEEYPELYRLEQSCPPLGQVIAACQGGNSLSMREEKILFHTVGFLPRAKTLLHRLLREQSEYNPHMVDYKISRLRGTPLGCRRIHSLLSYAGDYCRFECKADYAHPLLHLGQGAGAADCAKAEKVENLAGAIDNLRAAILQVERFLK